MNAGFHFWVYILASRSRNLCTGMTNDLIRRVTQYREQAPGTYTAPYKIHRLVYFEHFRYVRSAIAREKEIKRWTRAQRICLVETQSPTWLDLYPDLVDPATALIPNRM